MVANDITPSDAASLDHSSALAMVTETGSKTSHTVIVARLMKIPAVVGVRNLTSRVRTGDWAIVDGYEGTVIIRPSEQTLFRYGKIQLQKRSFERRLIDASREPAVTLDGTEISLMANIEKVEEVAQVKEFLGQGVGLFRTEYLYLNSAHIPTEEEQFEAYRKVVQELAPFPVIIRTLDLGGDKPMPSIPALNHKEANPFLGFRAIRFCLENPAIFKDQLRAILRASAHGKVQMMFPMISGADELLRAKAMLEECKAELRVAGKAFDEKLSVGAMIEIPSAATTADVLARHCDFFSIGTNDLIQYLLAIDRGNDRIAHLYEPTHPAVLRTLRSIVQEAHRRNIPVGVCGEMAGDPIFTPLLIGLGVDSLSMAPIWLPTVKFLIRAMKLSDAKALAEEALAMDSAKEIYATCDAFYRARIEVDA